MLIRVALPEDLNAWADMRVELWPNTTKEEHLADVQFFFGQKTFRGWVAIEEGIHIGFAEASIRPFANGCESRPVVFLEGIWVDEGYRQRGVSRLLLDLVEKWARSQNIHEIGSDTELHNTASQTVHGHWGFKETERVVYFRKVLPK